MFVLLAVVSGPAWARDQPEQVFWQWFQVNEPRLYEFESDQARNARDLSAALKKVDLNLTFEFGPMREGRRELALSAGGIRAGFPSVESLWAAAPRLPRWRFLKFRPRRNPLQDISSGGQTVRAADVSFVLFRDDNPAKAGVRVFLPGYSAGMRSQWTEIGYLFLEEAVGEYDAVMRVGQIVFDAPGPKYTSMAKPLAELPGYFDAVLAEQKAH